MKATALFIAVLLFVAHVGAQDFGHPTASTPYDTYFGPMRSTMSALGSNEPSLDVVKGYVRTGRGFRYVMKHPYIPQTPAETEATHAGDCKAKSLWVASKMDDRSVRFVVGKARAVSGMSHAWLLWRGPNGWLVLDPTNYSSPLDASRMGPSEFIAFYSYSGSGKFIHPAATAQSAQRESKYADH